ncbi:MAG: hypothetical protein NUV75_01985 [Gallionella sp.]|nr:hypothetical protein [Gallionella sp.]
MATTRIAYSTASAVGKEIAEFVDATMDALARGRRLKAQFLAMASDAPAIEAEVGGMVAGTGNDLWYVLNQGVVAIDVDAVNIELAKLDQG